MKKLFLTMAAVVTALVMTAGLTFADAAGFAAEADTTHTAKTPYDKRYVKIDWHTPEGETVGVPLAVDEYLFVPTLNKVNKLSEKNGEVIASVEFDEKVSESCSGVITESTLIQPARTSLYVIDTVDMSVLCSRTFGEIVTDVACADGLAYFGFKGSNDEDSFTLCCADISNKLETVWEYTSEKPVTSPARLGENVIFGAGDKLVVRTENGFVENDAGAEITHVFAGKYAVFMCCGNSDNGELRKLRLDEDGKAEDDSLGVCEIGGKLTAPVGIDNHIYVGSDEGFFVIDGLNMEIMKEFPELKNASAPVLTIGSGVRAYTAAPHADADGDRWYLYSVLDTDESQTLSELAKIIDFTDGKAAVSKSGRMFFRDAKGQVWAISESKPSVIVGIIKVILVLAILIMLILILRAWAKNRQAKKPPEF